MRSATSLLGPVLGAALVAGAGSAWAFVFDATLSALSVVLLFGVRLPERAASDGSFIADLREGWGEFRSRTWLWVIVAAFGVMNAIHVGMMAVVGPVIAKNDSRLGVAGWGRVMAAEAVGSLIMGAVLLKLRINRPLVTGMLGMACFSMPFVMLGVEPRPVILIPLMVLAGAGLEMFGTGWNVAMMEQIPREVFSRVVSYDMLGSFVAMPIGSFAFGILAAHVPVSRLTVVAGVVYLGVVFSTLLVADVRNLRRVDDGASVSAAEVPGAASWGRVPTRPPGENSTSSEESDSLREGKEKVGQSTMP